MYWILKFPLTKQEFEGFQEGNGGGIFFIAIRSGIELGNLFRVPLYPMENGDRMVMQNGNVLWDFYGFSWDFSLGLNGILDAISLGISMGFTYELVQISSIH